MPHEAVLRDADTVLHHLRAPAARREIQQQKAADHAGEDDCQRHGLFLQKDPRSVWRNQPSSFLRTITGARAEGRTAFAGAAILGMHSLHLYAAVAYLLQVA